MKTITAKQLTNEERKWYVIDAQGQNLWRLSVKIATILKGKNKVSFTPHIDNGDYVIVLNAWKIEVTWNKLEAKTYYSHSHYMWGIKEISLSKLLVKKPTEALKKSVSWMLPKNKLRRKMLDRLKLVEWAENLYSAQQPELITL